MHFPRSACQLLLAAICACSFALCVQAADAPAAATNQGVMVTTVTANTANWPVTISAQGEVLPWEVAVVSAKTQGVGAVEVKVLEGDVVRKGQVLARFDDHLLRAQLNQAKANLAVAAANATLAASNLKRMEALKAKHVLSAQEYEQVANTAATAEAMQTQAAAAVTLADIKLADATLQAPDDGKILWRSLELGQVAQGGEPLFRLLRQNKLEWVVQIDGADRTRVKVDMPVQIRLANNQTWSGKIRSISPQLTANSRLAQVRVLLDGTPDIAVNTFTDGHILAGNTAAIVVPANCVVVKDGKTWVFKVKDGQAQQQLVSLGRRDKNDVEITSGLAAGDKLVQEGAGFLNSGDKIQVPTIAPAGAAK